MSSDDRTTRDQRPSLYAQGLRDLTKPPAVQRVAIVDSVERSQLPSGSPLVGFSETIAAAPALHGALAFLAPLNRGAVLESLYCDQVIGWSNLATGGSPFGGAVAAPYRANLPGALPGRLDPNSGLAFQGFTYASGTGPGGGENLGWDVIARRGTVGGAEPSVTGPRFSPGYHRLEWPVEPGFWVVFACITANTAVNIGFNVRVPLIPTPLV